MSGGYTGYQLDPQQELSIRKLKYTFSVRTGLPHSIVAGFQEQASQDN